MSSQEQFLLARLIEKGLDCLHVSISSTVPISIACSHGYNETIETPEKLTTSHPFIERALNELARKHKESK